MISSWPMNVKVIRGEFELKDLEQRNHKGRKDFADILAQQDSRDSVFNKGGSSDDWMGDYMTGEKARPQFATENGADSSTVGHNLVRGSRSSSDRPGLGELVPITLP